MNLSLMPDSPVFLILLKWTCLLGLGWLFQWVLHNQHARWRLILWRSILCCGLLLPLLSFVHVPGIRIPITSDTDPTTEFANTTGAGVYSFTASGITLSPSTVYWAVATSLDSAISGNTVYWAFDPNNYTSVDGWSLGLSPYHAFHGANWQTGGGGSPFTLAITASAVPEPHTFSLTGLGLFLILLLRRKKIRVFW